jgi:hypothetical protein
VLFGAPLFLVGCGSVSISRNYDAASGSPDGPSVAADLPNTPIPDAGLDLAPLVQPDGPVAGQPDAAQDGAVADVVAPADESGAVMDSLPAACEFQGGNIVSDLKLTKECSPYSITDYIQVNGEAVLTIEPGVTLNFEGGLGLEVGNADLGKLVAVGTAQDPITFTSSATPPLPGDWGAIRLFDGTMAGTRIEYARVDSCGADRSGCIVGDGVLPNSVTIDHVTIDRVGPDSNGIMEWDTDSNFVITNSTFSNIPDGRYAISVQAPSFAGIGSGNTFNSDAMIELVGGTISATTYWVDPGTAIAVTDSLWIEGTDNPVLTLGAGMTLMFAPANPPLELSVGRNAPGGLVIAGAPNAGKSVVLTSLSVSPDSGDWVGVEVWAAGTAKLSYADISYAGSDGIGGGDFILENGNSAATIEVDHSSFMYSRGYGIYVDCADPAITLQATVTLNAGNTYAFNESDPMNTGSLSSNVGPGLDGPDCTLLHHH